MLNRLVKNSRFERFDVSNYVRQFRHGAILAELETIHSHKPGAAPRVSCPLFQLYEHRVYNARIHVKPT